MIFIGGMEHLGLIIFSIGISTSLVLGIVLLFYLAWKTLND